jgi:hypothetical protein
MNGVGLGTAVVLGAGAASSPIGGLSNSGSGWPDGGGFCAIAGIGQISKEKAIFRTVFMINFWHGQKYDSPS